MEEEATFPLARRPGPLEPHVHDTYGYLGLAVASCPSVHLSVTRRYHVLTAKYIVILFHRPVAPPSSYFHSTDTSTE